MAYTFDGPNKLVVLSAGTTSVSVRDLWSRWVDWTLTGDNSKYLPALRTVGGDVIDSGAGTRVPTYAYLLNGWRIRPQEADHTLTITDGVLLVDGGGDPFVSTVGDWMVRVRYQQPVQAISFDTGASGGGATAEQIAAAVWAYVNRTLTGTVPANVKQVNDVPLAGTGQPGSDPWRPAA